MEKATHPTSVYTVACDLFDTVVEVSVHDTKDGAKCRITIDSESGGKPLSVSLFAEDVHIMAAFLDRVSSHITKRGIDDGMC